MIPQAIHNELDVERVYQVSKGNDADFDDKNTLSDWGAYIADYLGRAVSAESGFSNSRKNLVKVATLACAALEAWDKNKGFPPRHFDTVMVFPREVSLVHDHLEQR